MYHHLHYLLTTSLPTRRDLTLDDDDDDTILMNLNLFLHSLIAFLPMLLHHPLHPHKSYHLTNDSHQLHQTLQIQILVYLLHLLLLV